MTELTRDRTRSRYARTMNHLALIDRDAFILIAAILLAILVVAWGMFAAFIH